MKTKSLSKRSNDVQSNSLNTWLTFRQLSHIKTIMMLAVLIVLSACQPPEKTKGRTDGIPEINVATKSEQICEVQIRDKINNKQIEYTNEPKFTKLIAEANNTIHRNENLSEYSFEEVNGQIQEISKRYIYNLESNPMTVEFAIGLNQEDSKHSMFFKIRTEMYTDKQKTEFIQNYSVNQDCTLTLKRTSLNQYKKLNEKQIEYSDVAVADSETVVNEKTTFEVPEGKTSVDFMMSGATFKENFQALQKLKTISNPVYVIPSLGFVDISIRDLPRSEQNAFGENYQFDRQEFEVNYDGKILANVIFHVDLAKETALTFDSGNQSKTWILPTHFKSQISLGQVQLGKSYFKSNVSQENLVKDAGYILETNKKITYDNFSAYYQSKRVNENNESFKYSLVETYPPVTSGQSSPDDLLVNSTIQSDLPEIQSIAHQISASAKDRNGQIAGILKYLSKNYAYDYDMLEKEKIRALTTKEALDRKKGVCQHYAVLYTAIARALKIPSRIIVGYLIQGTKTGLHAWVESEISEGQWQVIEPQNPEGLTRTRTRFYMPLLRGDLLEDMNTSSKKWIMTLFDLKMTAKPLSK